MRTIGTIIGGAFLGMMLWDIKGAIIGGLFGLTISLISHKKDGDW